MLNANHIAAEAEIVADAGKPGSVTVSTNMAGRGTDIKLGEGVAELGGLHVICTEMHDVGPHRPPVDRPLRPPGRSRHVPRHTWPWTTTCCLGLGPEKAKNYKELGERPTGPVDHLGGLFRKAQRSIERRHFRDRKVLMYHEKERKKMQQQMGQDPYLDTPG